VMFQNEQQKYSPIQATGNACLNASQEAHAFNNSVLITQDILKDRRRRPEGGVNGSQSKFLTGTWPMSQSQTDVPLY
jgi:hypothetical protein